MESIEVWKDIEIKDFDWLYQVSTLWKVRIIKELKWKISWNWYRYLTWSNNWSIKQVKFNRLIAMAFLWLNISDKKTIVCHKNDNTLDDRLENLFLWTHKDNMCDMMRKWRWRWQFTKKV